MIAFIKGVLEEVNEGSLVVDVNGMGYEVFVPNSVNEVLPAIGQKVKLYTYLQVKEDNVALFGFRSKDDLALFKLLITVNGIGPKGALGILSAFTANDLRFAILAEDAKAIQKAPGIGAKTAGKVILELKDKVKLSDTFESAFQQTENKAVTNQAELSSMKEEAVQALTSLGYSASDALRAVRAVTVTDGMTSEELLRLSLKNF